MNIILYNHKENQGITAFLAQSEIVYTLYNYNGVGLTMPQGEIRVNADLHVTHFATTIAGRMYICKITGIKAINASVITYSYVIDYLKDYAAQTSGIGRVFCKAPIKREWNGTDLSRWARWIDDPLYQGYGGTRSYSLGAYSDTTNCQWFCMTVSNARLSTFDNTNIRYGFPCSVYIFNKTYLDALISYLMFNDNGAAFYKQIVSCFALPLFETVTGSGGVSSLAWLQTENISFAISGDWEYIASSGSGAACYIVKASGGSNLPAYSYTIQQSITIRDFRDIYRTSYYIEVGGIAPFKLPLTAYLPVAASQTTDISYPLSLQVSYNFIDGHMEIESGILYIPHSVSKCALPSISLPSGSTAFSIVSQEKKMASTAFGIGTSALINYASGNYAGLVNNAGQIATSMFSNTMQNELTQAAGNSYSNTDSWDLINRSYIRFMKITTLFREDYSAFAANRGYIPYGPIVDYGESIPADAYSLLSGKSILYDTEAMDFWIDDDVAANEDYYNDLVAAMTGKVIHFNSVYIPTF